jgi:hypothetical protein
VVVVRLGVYAQEGGDDLFPIDSIDLRARTVARKRGPRRTRECTNTKRSRELLSCSKIEE